MKKPSKAGIRVQQEWADLETRPDIRAHIVNDDHGDARHIEWKASEKARIAAKKEVQAQAKVRKVEERKVRGAAHCQICGGDVLASTGVIAHHGYKRPGNGWQTASCLGARFVPYEQSRDRIPYVLGLVTSHIEATERRLAEVTVEAPEVMSYTERVRVKEFQSWHPQGYKNVTIEVPRPEGFDPSDKGYRHEPYTGHASFRSLYEALIQNLKADLRGSRETEAYLADRFNRWVVPNQIQNVREATE